MELEVRVHIMSIEAVKNCPVCRHELPIGNVSRKFAKRACKGCGAKIEFIPTLEDWSMGNWKAVYEDGSEKTGVWKY